MMLLALYSSCIPSTILSYLWLAHYLLMDLARLNFFFIPAISLINTIETIQY